ncbi:MAG: hypothetical protein P1V81_05075 [Planctomycetota bacterium]|nr:hypothetical protein [Planctomycetota bacterium]
MFDVIQRPLATLARACALPGLGLLLAAGSAAAQVTPSVGGGQPGVYQGPMTQHPLVVPATPFQWTTSAGLGAVKVPFPGQFGWKHFIGLNFQARMIPSVSTDPTMEVIFYPPASGHPTKAERITIQFPMDPGKIRGSGAMVLAFHGFGVSEKDIFVNTQLPQLCAQRGYILVAPYGLTDTHYGNLPSQASLDKVLELVDAFFDWDEKRVYAAGFSMGGGAAISYAMRRQDDGRRRIAGLINHTGTMDLLGTYNDGTTALKLLMADSDHFGTHPGDADSAFPYERVSPVVLNGTAVDPMRAPVRNLSHLPIFQYVNLDDPQVNLVNDNLAVGSYLLSQGVNLNQVTNHAGSQHAWSTLDMATALDWLEHYSLPDLPTDSPVFADTESKYFHTTVRAKTDKRVASFEIAVDLASATIEVTETNELDVLFLDLVGMGLNTSQFLVGTWGSADGTGDQLVLGGIASAPSQVLFGGQPSTNWSHDPATSELTLEMRAGTTPVIWSVAP